jgi:outer membrane protein
VAEIHVRNEDVQKDILLRNFGALAVQTYRAFLSALEQRDSQKVNLLPARKLVHLVLQRFQLYAATMIELIQAEQSFQNPAYTLMNVTSAAKSSEIELKRLINRLCF